MTVSNPVMLVADPAIEYVDLLLQCKELTAIHSLGARLRNFAWLNIREYRALRSAKRKPVFFGAVIVHCVWTNRSPVFLGASLVPGVWTLPARLFKGFMGWRNIDGFPTVPPSAILCK